jgi:hypothetical protein
MLTTGKRQGSRMKGRRRLSLAMVTGGGLLFTAGLAVAAPASASSQVHGNGTVARAAASGPRRWVVYNPKAYAAAVKSKDWVYTPEGLAYKSCVYHVPAGAIIDHGVIIKRNGTRTPMACAHPTLAYPAANSKRNAVQPGTAAAPANCPATNPNWWAEACAVAPTWENYLWERFSVPSNPAKSGALIFFFPSLQDQGQDTILQPVLTWGANSITNVSNPNIWYITNWYVWGNNYAITNNIHVGTGQTIDGAIVATSCNANGANCTWTVESSVEGGASTTPLTVVSGVAFTNVEAGVMEVPRAVGCVETPPNGHEAFRNLTVATHNGNFAPKFNIYYPNRQCSVSQTASSTGSDILWKS